MYIEKVHIENFKCFEGEFDLVLNPGLNILVGDNEAGKSTILEAINLALSGWINGKYISTELTQALFNSKVISNYLSSLQLDESTKPPEIIIELYLHIDDKPLKALFQGNGNTKKKITESGIQFKISFDQRYKKEYEFLLNSGEALNFLPIEFYEFSWSSFARDNRMTPKVFPIKSALIDSSDNRGRNGSDIYISRIIRDLLSDESKVKVSLAHRKLSDAFSNDLAISEINNELAQKKVSEKQIRLSIDVKTKNAWETSLTTYLDEIPFQNIGKGEQSMIKAKLALSHKKAKEASVLLIEEPENHLSHTKLSSFLSYIKDNNIDKQIVISTHSSYVANKIGLESLILLNRDLSSEKRSRLMLDELSEDTKQFFMKLSGYDTLRLILCKKAILVEGPSDELIIQRAYIDKYEKLPIEDEIDVISVGTTFLRFLEIAKELEKEVIVVTDNDGDFVNKITKKYQLYQECSYIKVCASDDEKNPTLEPQIVNSNSNNLDLLREILSISKEKYSDSLAISNYMIGRKTESALKIFDSKKMIVYPDYIVKAIR